MTGTAIEALRGWISTGALLGLLTFAARYLIQNRKLRMQEKIDDRQGFGTLIERLEANIERLERKLSEAEGRIKTLEAEREGEHKLILELIRQTNRTQAASILASNSVSPAIRRALESTISPEQTG
jgi:predicted RNase H-like nuclease (RuvC/YqgF family)